MTAGAPDTPASAWVVAAVVVGLALAGLLAWLLVSTGDQPAVSRPTASPTPQGGRLAGDDTDDGGGCRWDRETLIVGGVTVPADCQHGPYEVEGGRLAGWARTRRGAAYAAAGLRVATAPQVGPDAYRPTIGQQTFGPESERSVLLDDVAQAYAALEQQHQLDGGAYQGTWPHGRIAGYRVAAYTDATATVWLLLEGGGHQVAQRIDLRWLDGGWQASAQTLRRWHEHLNRHPVAGRYERFNSRG
jgi:hypothetical protein